MHRLTRYRAIGDHPPVRAHATGGGAGALEAAQAVRNLDALLLDTAVKLGSGVRANGTPTRWTIDCRETLLQAPALHTIGRAMWHRIAPYRPDAVGGPSIAADPLTASVLLAALADDVALHGFMIRRERKRVGMSKQVEGPDLKAGQRVAVLDDVINRGKSLRRSLDALAPLGVKVVVVGTIVNFQATGERWLQQAGLPLEALTTLQRLGVRAEDRPVAAAVISRSLSPDQVAAYRRSAHMADDSPRAVRADALTFSATSEGELTAIESGTGQLRWQRRLGQTLRQRPAVAGDTVLQACTQHLAAVAADDGTLLWLCPFDSDIVDGPVRIGHNAAVVERSGCATIVDVQHGQTLARIPATGPSVVGVLSAGDEFVFLRTDGGALCVDAAI